MIISKFGRYAPTPLVSEDNNYKNMFESVIDHEKELDLTEAYNKSKEWLDHHMGFVLLYHNGVLLKRLCNYKLFKDTFDKMNLKVILKNHL